MIFEETVLKGTDISETISYLCGYLKTEVKKIEITKNKYFHSISLETKTLNDLGEYNLPPFTKWIDITFVNDQYIQIEVKSIGLGGNNYIVDFQSSGTDLSKKERFKYISGVF